VEKVERDFQVCKMAVPQRIFSGNFKAPDIFADKAGQN
jgi:hypothetical protein